MALAVPVFFKMTCTRYCVESAIALESQLMVEALSSVRVPEQIRVPASQVRLED